MVIWSNFKQYILEAAPDIRIPFQLARDLELDFRREIFQYISKHRCTFDQMWSDFGYTTMRRLFQYQISIYKDGSKSNQNQSQDGQAQRRPRRDGSTRPPRVDRVSPYPQGGKQRGKQKGNDSILPRPKGKGGGGYVVGPNPKFYDSYNGVKFCIPKQYGKPCNVRNCTMIHGWCNFVGCPNPQNCKAGNHPK